jgi:hypothetical protein
MGLGHDDGGRALELLKRFGRDRLNATSTR